MYSYQDLVNYLKYPAKSYQQGLLLYNVYKHSSGYDKFFSSVKDANPDDPQFSILLEQLLYIENKLRYNEKFTPKVENLSQQLPEIQLTPIVAKKQIVRIDEQLRIDINTLPSDLFIQYQENKENWNKIKALHAELRVLPFEPEFNNQRRMVLNQISALEHRNRDIWKTIESWNEETNNVTSKADKVDSVEKSINSLRRKIAKTKEYLKVKNLRKNTYDRYSGKLELLQKNLDELIKSNQTTDRSL